MQLDNVTIGRNIYKLRKLKDIKAIDIAAQLGLKEAAYTKYERGETAITIEFVQKVAEVLQVDPVQIISTTPSNIFEMIQHSNVAISGTNTNTYNAADKQQMEMMLRLLDQVARLNERLIAMLESPSALRTPNQKGEKGDSL